MKTGHFRLRSVIDQDGAGVLDLERGTIAALNSTGGQIWQALERGESADEIAVRISCETGHALSLVERDVRQFIEDLREHHLLPR